MKMIKVISANILALMCSKTFAMDGMTIMIPGRTEDQSEDDIMASDNLPAGTGVKELQPDSICSDDSVRSEVEGMNMDHLTYIKSINKIDIKRSASVSVDSEQCKRASEPLRKAPMDEIPEDLVPLDELKEKHASPAPEPHARRGVLDSIYMDGLMESACMTVTRDCDQTKYHLKAHDVPEACECKTYIEMQVCPVNGSGAPTKSRYIAIPENSSVSIGRNHGRKYRRFPHMSRNHFVVTRKEKGKGIMVTDCGSTNGTFLICGDQKLFRLHRHKQHSLTQITMAGNGIGIVYRIDKERGWIKFILHEPDL